VNADTVLSLIFVVTAVLGYIIGTHRGHPVLGLLLGLVAGPVGLAVLVFVPRQRRRKGDEHTGAAPKRTSRGVRAGVIVDRRFVLPRTKWVRGERMYHPPTHDSQTGYGTRGRWD
jgi:hypothetical protein